MGKNPNYPPHLLTELRAAYDYAYKHTQCEASALSAVNELLVDPVTHADWCIWVQTGRPPSHE